VYPPTLWLASSMTVSTSVFSRREEKIQDYLTSAGVPISRVAGNLERLDIPGSRFDFDVIGTLSSVPFESMFVTRAVRSRLLEESYLSAQKHVSRTIRLLRSPME
jgi:hypothetical protein